MRVWVHLSWLLLLPLAALAQPPMPPRLLPPPHLLLHQKSVQDDLKLTQQQFLKIRELMFRDMQQLKQLQASLPAEEFKQKMHEMFKEKDKKVVALLQPSQQKRFKQIVLQLKMPRVFTEDAVATQLKLDEDQQQQMRSSWTPPLWSRRNYSRAGPSPR